MRVGVAAPDPVGAAVALVPELLRVDDLLVRSVLPVMSVCLVSVLMGHGDHLHDHHAPAATDPAKVLAIPANLVTEGRCVLLADPLPHRHRAAEFGTLDELRLVELAGVEADRADQESPARSDIALDEAGQRRAAVTRDRGGDA